MRIGFASATLCAAALVAGVNVRSGDVVAQMAQEQMGHETMKTPAKMETMKDTTFTGCVAAGEVPKTFVLTHVAATGDGMSKDAASADSMMKMGQHAMHETSVAISSKAVDLGKHVGQKVSVTGAGTGKMDSMGKDMMGAKGMGKDAMAGDAMAMSSPAVVVKTLKVIAASCR